VVYRTLPWLVSTDCDFVLDKHNILWFRENIYSIYGCWQLGILRTQEFSKKKLRSSMGKA
jgi:hypothetical protein